MEVWYAAMTKKILIVAMYTDIYTAALHTKKKNNKNKLSLTNWYHKQTTKKEIITDLLPHLHLHLHLPRLPRLPSATPTPTLATQLILSADTSHHH